MRTAIILTLMLFVSAACARCSEGDKPPVPVAIPTPTSTAIPAPASTQSVSTNARLVIEDGQGAVGDTIPVEVAIYNIATGVAGYAIQVTSADPNIARITNVNMPDYGLTMVGDLPADTVDITAVDLPGLLEGVLERETLATLDVELLSRGNTQILVELRILDDDLGQVVTPQIENGNIQVN